MPLQTSGPISLNDIGGFFGATNPYAINQFYRGGSYVPNIAANNNVPTSGKISISNFYGAAKTLNTVTYTNTGGTNSFTVPTNVTALVITAVGGGGGSGGSYAGAWTNSYITTYNGATGGSAQSVSGTLTVTPGQTYTINPGGSGSYGLDNWNLGSGGNSGSNANSSYSGASGSYNSGGGGGGGGAASIILLGSTPIVVAAGGGGGNAGNGGSGGSGGGSNVLPSGFTATSASNGGAGASLSAYWLTSFGTGGSGALSSIYSQMKTTYAAAYVQSSITDNGNSRDFVISYTINPGAIQWGYNNNNNQGPYLTAGNATVSGNSFQNGHLQGQSSNYYAGQTVSGIGSSEGNGGSEFQIYTGVVNNNGGNGYITIQYYT
jgi:hypothetical protein